MPPNLERQLKELVAVEMKVLQAIDLRFKIIRRKLKLIEDFDELKEKLDRYEWGNLDSDRTKGAIKDFIQKFEVLYKKEKNLVAIFISGLTEAKKIVKKTIKYHASLWKNEGVPPECKLMVYQGFAHFDKFSKIVSAYVTRLEMEEEFIRKGLRDLKALNLPDSFGKIRREFIGELKNEVYYAKEFMKQGSGLELIDLAIEQFPAAKKRGLKKLFKVVGVGTGAFIGINSILSIAMGLPFWLGLLVVSPITLAIIPISFQSGLAKLNEEYEKILVELFKET